MLFVTHLAAAALVGRWTRLAPAWLVVGAALPDLVDKPLATVGLVDVYHSVGHSALLVAVAIPVALVGRAGLAVAVGWGSHLLLDAAHVIINGRAGDALFLAWPLTGPADPLRIPPGAFFVYYVGTPAFYLEVGFWLALAVLVARRGLSASTVAER
ncbi:metal-dependent hydrolase [Halosegnis sp.]|uniref:metal-dependent hydrolase n=1 Tax=Halosegnis sp. TaxID=2864959 RepID=UPI0035D45346